MDREFGVIGCDIVKIVFRRRDDRRNGAKLAFKHFPFLTFNGKFRKCEPQ